MVGIEIRGQTILVDADRRSGHGQVMRRTSGGTGKADAISIGIHGLGYDADVAILHDHIRLSALNVQAALDVLEDRVPDREAADDAIDRAIQPVLEEGIFDDDVGIAIGGGKEIHAVHPGTAHEAAIPVESGVADGDPINILQTQKGRTGGVGFEVDVLDAPVVVGERQIDRQRALE